MLHCIVLYCIVLYSLSNVHLFFRFWNLGLERYITHSRVIRESQDFSSDHQIAAILYPEGIENATDDFCKPKSVELNLLGSDTDSFCWSVTIPTDNFNTLKRNEIIFWRLMYHFIITHDCCDIDNLCMKTHPLWRYNPDSDRMSNLLEIKSRNRKKLGMFTSERPTSDSFIAKCIFLKSKLYCIMSVSDCQKTRCKGVNREVVKEEMSYSMFENTIKTGSMTYHSMNNFRARKFDIFLENINKKSLSLICQKRFWVSRYISYPHGFHVILKCDYCRQKYSSTDRLSEHDLICMKNPFNLFNDDDDMKHKAILHWTLVNDIA